MFFFPAASNDFKGVMLQLGGSLAADQFEEELEKS